MDKGKRIGLDTIGRGRFAGRPLQQHTEPDPAIIDATTNEAEPLKDQRWLYDDEDEFKRAQKKVSSEIAREKAKKELAQKARIAKLKQLAKHGKTLAAKGGSHAVKHAIKHTKTAASRAKTALKKPKARKKILIATPLVAVALLGFSILSPKMGSPNNGQIAGENTQVTPAFTTLTPNKDIKNVNDGKLAYDKNRQVASFADSIGQTPVTVSQQPLPERFKKDPLGELGKFAEEIYAKDKIVAKTATAYTGVSIKGPQTTVVIKNDLLIFISAGSKISNDELSAYIDALQ